MELTERLRQLVIANAAAVIDDDHPLHVEAIAGSENILFEIDCLKEDIGLVIGAGGRHIEAIRTMVRGGCRGAKIRTAVEVKNSRR